MTFRKFTDGVLDRLLHTEDAQAICHVDYSYSQYRCNGSRLMKRTCTSYIGGNCPDRCGAWRGTGKVCA